MGSPTATHRGHTRSPIPLVETTAATKNNKATARRRNRRKRLRIDTTGSHASNKAPAVGATTQPIQPNTDGDQEETETDTTPETPTVDIAFEDLASRDEDNNETPTTRVAPAMSGLPPTPRNLGFSIRNVILREYDPSRDGLVDVWIQSVKKAIAADEAMMGARWPEPPLYHLASGKLLGNAATWLRQYERATPMEERTLQHFFGALKERFGTKLDEIEVVERLAQRGKRVGESYAEYAEALSKLAEGVDIPERQLLSAFLRGLGRAVGPLIRAQKPRTINEAVYEAELNMKSDGRDEGEKERARPARALLVRDEGRTGEDVDQQAPWPQGPYQWPTPTWGKRPASQMDPGDSGGPPTPGQGQSQPWGKRPRRERADIQCFKCRQMGHYARECRYQPKGNPAPVADEDDAVPNEVKTEAAAEAEELKAEEVTGGAASATGARIRVEASGGLPTARVRLRDKATEIIIDTGASYSVAGEKLRRHGQRLAGPPPVQQVQGLGGTCLPVLGVWKFELRTVYEQTLVVDVLVVDGCGEEFILGSDFWTGQRATISYETCEATFMKGDTRVVVPFTFKDAKGGDVRLARGLKVPTQSQCLVRLPVEAAAGTVGLFLPAKTSAPHLLVPATVARVHEGHVTVPVLNVLGKKVKLPARTQLGRWVPLDDEMELMSIDGTLERPAVERWLETMRPATEAPLPGEDELALSHLSEEDRALVLRTLRCFPRIVSAEKVCPPPTDTGVCHVIPTGTAAPISTRRWRHAEQEKVVIDRHVEEMLKAGVIEMGNGPWCFPVVLVKKKDGSVRFCVDYRALNAVTAKDVYPLPRIDETVEALGGATLFSTMDLMAGYWQIPVAPEDRDKTAFATRQGLFRFRRMPFGLSNAPGTFQRLMDCVLRGLSWICCLVYLDDIIVYSRGPVERHLVKLAAVLARLEDAGLTIKLKKCVFAAPKIEYLGHELSEEGVRPTDRLLRAIRDAPVPTDATEVRRFVHLAGYYRRFIPEFGRKAEPLTRLLRKNEAWQWGPEQDGAVGQLKKELTSKPVLRYPDFQRPFVLATDASLVGLGAALMQDHGDGLQPVGFASKVNSETQTKYGITELECLAVVWAINQFRPYLYGREFQVITDHVALKWLMTAKEPNKRLHRWALSLQEYNFTIVYRPGKSNVVPDALSRAPVRVALGVETNGARETLESRGAAQIDLATLREHQRRSRMCTEALTVGTCKGRAVRVHDGVVEVHTDDGWRLLLPATLRTVALKACHESAWAGHLRGPQTLARIRRSFWWPGVARTVGIWLTTCRDCGSRKVRPAKVIPPLRSLRVGEVGDRWALDIAGPLPRTASGNRYVVAIVEYVTKFVVAEAVPTRAAEKIASVLRDRVVLQFGPMRELITDGARELQSATMKALVLGLQAKQSTSVPYRPNLLGQVERFNRTWKDIVSMYVNEAQTDWDEWVPVAAYAYNSARNTVTGFTPFELMTGREPRAPWDLLLPTHHGSVDDLPRWYENTRARLRKLAQFARLAISKEQLRQARCYDRRSRREWTFEVNELTWVFRPTRGPGISKLRHRWIGPCRILEPAGYENFLVLHLDTAERLLVHESMLLPFSTPSAEREEETQGLLDELDDSSDNGTGAIQALETVEARGVSTASARPIRAVAPPAQVGMENLHRSSSGVFFVERGRRRARNRIGRYEVEVMVEIRSGSEAGTVRWMTFNEFESFWAANKDIEDDVAAGEGE
ncbi:hypothetical protein P43SY_010532 [Pythium insidiosum]|uniref:RNA-directed DNA polymerase n=1 Tax=Pythium insidiosum TaxID=114742 RepID=A0AAD5LA33_PYTIN|nr:hypothetical protein P43SY_010532 [Pythium insidiosum]